MQAKYFVGILFASWCLHGCGANQASVPSSAANNNPIAAAAPSSHTACAAAWSPTQVYNAGDTASLNNVNYTATYWTQNQSPDATNGAAGSGQPWQPQSSCTSGATSNPNSASNPNATGNPNTQNRNAPTGPATPLGNFVFGPYKDVTISANWNTSVISTKVTGELQPLVNSVPAGAVVTWSFGSGECGAETWGGMTADTLAKANVQAWAAANKPYILSTGGASGVFTCGSDAGFAAFLDRFMSASLVGVDFDIEAGQTPETIAALVARVKAAQTNPKYSRLRFSFTLATLAGNTPKSLSSLGDSVMVAIKDAGLASYTINLMTMDYATPTASNCTLSGATCAMGASAAQAAKNLHEAYGTPFNQIELTPMIGGNDSADETFTLDDVTTTAAFAKQNGLAGLHYWSLDRDVDCAPGSASASCNSYGQAGVMGFLNKFMGAL